MKRAEEFKQIKEEFENIKAELNDKIEKCNTVIEFANQIQDLTTKKNAIDEFFNSIHEGNNGQESLNMQVDNVYEKIQEFNEKIEESTNKQDELNQYYIEIFGALNEETQTREDGFQQEVETLQLQIQKVEKFFENIDDLEQRKNNTYNTIQELNEKIEESTNKQDELNKYYIRIFGSLNERTRTREGGLKQEIEMRREGLDTYKKEQEDVIKTLKKKIHRLMSSAVSVGLAKSFADEKKKFKEEVEKHSKYFTWCIASLVLLGVGKFLYDVFWNKTIDVFTISNVLVSFLSTLPLFAPLLWLAYSFAKRRNAYAMLYQEYMHKEAFANSYSSYKQQIEDLQDNDTTLLNELLEKAIRIIARNPTHVLTKKHSSDLPIEEIAVLIKACKGNTEAIANVIDNFLTPKHNKNEEDESSDNNTS